MASVALPRAPSCRQMGCCSSIYSIAKGGVDPSDVTIQSKSGAGDVMQVPKGADNTRSQPENQDRTALRPKVDTPIQQQVLAPEPALNAASTPSPQENVDPREASLSVSAKAYSALSPGLASALSKNRLATAAAPPKGLPPTGLPPGTSQAMHGQGHSELTKLSPGATMPAAAVAADVPPEVSTAVEAMVRRVLAYVDTMPTKVRLEWRQAGFTSARPGMPQGCLRLPQAPPASAASRLCCVGRPYWTCVRPRCSWPRLRKRPCRSR